MTKKRIVSFLCAMLVLAAQIMGGLSGVPAFAEEFPESGQEAVRSSADTGTLPEEDTNETPAQNMELVSDGTVPGGNAGDITTHTGDADSDGENQASEAGSVNSEAGEVVPQTEDAGKGVSVDDHTAETGDETDPTEDEDNPEGETGEEESTDEASLPARTFMAATDTMSVQVVAEEGTFPENTTLTVRDIDDEIIRAVIADVVGAEDTEVRICAVDICFAHEGEEIEPLRPVRVIMTPTVSVTGDLQIVHVDSEGEAEILEAIHEYSSAEAAVESVELKENSVVFNAESFSEYALVYTEEHQPVRESRRIYSINLAAVGEILASGTWGSGTNTGTWSVDSNGILTMSGTGEIPNYSGETPSNAPWMEYRSSITSLKVESGITRIGNNAFRGLTDLKSLELSECDTLKTIGNNAFQACESLENLSLNNPDLTTIGGAAFYGCAGLKSVDLSGLKELSSLGSDVFNGCTALESANLSGTKVSAINNNTFRDCTSLRSLDLSETSIAYFNGSSISNCTALEEVSFRKCEQLASIYNDAFNGKSALKSVDLTGCEALTNIGTNAFRNTAIETLDLSDTNLTALNNNLCYGCAGLKTVVLPKSESLTTINSSVFQGCASLEKFDFSQCPALQSIGSSVFQECTSLTEVDMTPCTSLAYVYQQAFYGCTSLQHVDMHGTAIVEFSNNVFSNCTALETVNLSECQSLKSLNGSMFGSDTALKAVDLHNCSGLTEIGQNLFNGKTLLSSVDMSGCTALQTIQSNAFYNCALTGTLDLTGTQLTSIANNAFQKCAGLEAVILPETLQTLGGSVFRDCTNLETADFSRCTNLTSIGGNVFENDKSLTSIDWSNCTSLTTVGSQIFRYCTALSSVDFSNIPAATIGSEQFSGCSGVKTFKMTNCPNFKELNSMLNSCDNIETVDLSNNPKLEKIGGNACRYKSYLREFNLAGCPIREIGAEAFRNDPLLTFNLNDIPTIEVLNNGIFWNTPAPIVEDITAFTELKKVYGGTFSNSPYLTDLDLSNCKKLQYVGDRAFAYCVNLKTVNFSGAGTEAYDDKGNFVGLTIGSQAFDMWQCNSHIESVDFSNSGLVSLGDSAFRNHPWSGYSLTSVDFTGCENLVTIGASAFSGYTTLTEIAGLDNLASLKEIKEYAFNNCRMDTVDLTGCTNLETIGEGAFQDCSNLTVVELDGCISLISIGTKAFYNDYSLSDINMSDCMSLQTIGEQAFSCVGKGNGANRVYGDAIETLVIPEGVTSIAAGALTGCKDITVLEWNAKNYGQEIAAGTFPFAQSGETAAANQNTNRFDLRIGSTVESLPQNFFYYLNNAGDIYFDGGQGGHTLKINMSETDKNRAPEPLRYIENGNCFVDASGVLYELFENDGEKTARIVYCPPETSSYTVPTFVNGDYKVTEVGISAFMKAKDLQSITFTTPGNITKIDEKAFYGLNTLVAVNAKDTVQEAKDSFTSENKTIANSAFQFTGLKDRVTSKAPGEKQTEKEYTLTAEQATVSLKISDGSFAHLDIDPVTGNTLQEEELKDGKEGTLHFLTGETLSLNVEAKTSNTTGGATVRVYFEFTQPDYTPVSGLKPTSDPNIYYYEFDVTTGNTETRSINWKYPSPASDGGEVKVWLEVFDEKLTDDQKAVLPTAHEIITATVQAEDGTEEVIRSTPCVGAKYVDADWVISRRERKLNKSGTPQTVSIGGNAEQANKNLYPLEVSAWDITMAYDDNGRTNTTNGSDYVRSATFTDKLTLPQGIEWDPEIIEALRAGDAVGLTTKTLKSDARVQKDIYLGKRKVLYLNFPDTDTLKDVSLSLDENNNVIISWTLKEMTGTKELSNLPVKMGVFEGTLVMNLDETYLSEEIQGDYKLAAASATGTKATEDDFPLRFAETIKNQVDVDLFYTHTQSRELKADAVISAEATKANLEFTKTRNSEEYTKLGDTTLHYTLRVENAGAQASYGLEYIEDTLEKQNGRTVSYFSPENMEWMFLESHLKEPNAALTVTIAGAAIYSWTNDGDDDAKSVFGNTLSVEPNTAEESGDGLNRYNSGTRTRMGTGTITITYNVEAGPYTVTYTPTSGEATAHTETGDDIAVLLEKLGYYVTAEDAYSARWDFSSLPVLEDSNADHQGLYRFDGGKVLELPVYASNKTTLQILPQDEQGSYQEPIDLSPRFTNKGTMQTWEKEATDSAYTKKSPVTDTATYYVSRELSLTKKEDSAGSVTGTDENSTIYLRMPVVEYQAVAANSGTVGYHVLPVTDTLSGSQALLAPVIFNAENTEQFVKCPKITVTNGSSSVQYYVLTEGSYNNIWLGQLKSGNSTGAACLADSVIVTKSTSSPISQTDPEYMEGLTGNKINYTSTVRWNLESLPAGSTRTILYDAVGIAFTSKDEALRIFSYDNIVYLNDLKGQSETNTNDRLFARISNAGHGIGSSYSIDKSIVEKTNDDHSEEELDGDDYSRINARDNSVTYKLTISYNPAREDMSVSFKGSEIYDCLPMTYGVFDWKMGTKEDIGKEGNVYVEVVRSDTEKVVLDNFFSGITVQKRGPGDVADNETYQYLRWEDTATVTLKGKCELDIYVTLTYANSSAVDTDQVNHWEKYCKAAKGDTLINTFYVCNKPASVTHDLVYENQAYLQKGVNYVYDLADTGNRAFYANGDYAYVEYYTVIYNGGYSKLYLADLIDEMPKGFTFHSVNAGANTYASTNGAGYTSCMTTYSTTGTNTPAVIKDSTLGEGNPVVYKAANIKADTSADGQVVFHISGNTNNDNFVSYDEVVALEQGENAAWYLNRGEAIAFTYTLKVDRRYDYTDDFARNRIYMSFNDPFGAGISRYEFDTTEEKENGVTGVHRGGVAFNDGSCYDFDGNRGLMSSVELERGEIIPGIQKSVLSYTYGNTTTPITSGGAISGGFNSVLWQVDAKNQGSQEINDYTLTDTIDLPLQPYGKVNYIIYDGNNKERVTAYTNVSTPAPFLFEITHISDEAVTLLDLMGKEYTVPYTIVNSDGNVVQSGKEATLPLPLVKYTYGNNGSEMQEGQAFQVTFTKTFSDATNKNGTVSMNLMFANGSFAVPPAGYGRLSLQTVPMGEIVSRQYTNRADFNPDRDYEKAGDGLNLFDFVRDSANITASSSGSTSSIKRITENQHPSNTGNSDPSPSETNTIVLADASNDFQYALDVKNSTNQNMTKLVVVDNLPEAGDHYTLQTGAARKSEFTVDFAEDPDVKVYIEGNENPLDSSKYTVQYSTKTTFTESDLKGTESSGWDADSKNARSIRVIINEPVPTEKTAKVIFHAKVAGAREEMVQAGTTVKLLKDHAWIPDNQGKIAYNSFAYWYNVGAFDLSAGTELVGVRLPSFPKLSKQVLNRMDERLSDEGKFTFVVYEGGKQELPDSVKNFGSSNLSVVTVGDTKYLQVQVTAGASSRDLYAHEFWTSGKTYTIEEVLNGERYQPLNWNTSDLGNDTVSGEGYVTFKYDGTSAQELTARNRDTQWNLEITKVKSTDQNKKLSGAWFALYSRKEAAFESIQFPAGIPEVDNNPADGNYRLGNDGSIRVPATYVDTSNTTWYLISVKETDGNGLASWTGLTGDLYLYHEVKAPNGYKIIDEGYTSVGPSDAGTVETTVKKTVENLYAGQHIRIQKADMLGQALTGAEFELYADDRLQEKAKDIDDNVIGHITVDTNGTADFGKLAAGTYYLVETKAPAGYNMLAEPVTITVRLEEDTIGATIIKGVNYDDGTNDSMNAKGITLTTDTDGGIVYTLMVHNSSGYELPSSGGPGTRRFAMWGMTLVTLAAVALYIRKRRTG